MSEEVNQFHGSDFQDQLIRGLAHKMNNYLSLFHGYLSLLMDERELDGETLEGLNGIREGATAASELIDRTKTLARPASIIWREIDLAKFMAQMKPTLESMAIRGEITVEIPNEMPIVLVDPGRLRMAIREIVKNACEAVKKRGKVTVRVLGGNEVPEPNRAEQALSWISIDVHDDGTGIPPELQEKVFQPFFTTRGRQNAIGLGLTVATELMRQMNGMLRFESSPGDTTFHLLLPAKSARF